MTAKLGPSRSYRLFILRRAYIEDSKSFVESDMLFPNRKLMRSYSDRYRMIQIPVPVAALWIVDGIEHVSITYVESEDSLVVKPVRSKSID